MEYVPPTNSYSGAIGFEGRCQQSINQSINLVDLSLSLFCLHLYRLEFIMYPGSAYVLEWMCV